ncbi:Glutamyl-tRNA(Gln) synthetase [hydrothermal vent metagenome]|uniref:glutamate--tRNA ligase n=1 Tax=hydrothermal vent metagenome TaxID=652676 RepID=A0A1W1CPU3_9ZZZZ
MPMIKTRFCPSPTGHIHIGNARTALFNVLYAIKHHGVFLLRIEDTDQERSEQQYIDQLCEDLKWLGLEWQEGYGTINDDGSFEQSKRSEVYKKYLQELEKKEAIYPCFCSAQDLEVSRKIQLKMGQPPRYDQTCRKLINVDLTKKHTIRFKVDKGEIVFEDFVKGQQVFKKQDIGDFIIKRSQGSEGFFFVNALDDALMGVTHALRGEDHLTNTPRQIMILEALKLPIPQYGHISLTIGFDGKPLSKRNGSMSIKQLRELGYFPEALVNYFARLGHSYESNELMSLQDLGHNFDEKRIGKAPAKFDIKQLNHWQFLAIAKKTNEQIWQWIKNEVEDIVPNNKSLEFVEIIRKNISFPKDARLFAECFWTELEFGQEEQKILSEAPLELFSELEKCLDNDLSYQEILDKMKTKTGLKGKSLFQPLRIVITTQSHGVEMEKAFSIIEKELIKRRIKDVITNYR